MASGMGFIATIAGLVVGWWISSNFLAGPAAQITGQLQPIISKAESYIPHQGGYGDDF